MCIDGAPEILLVGLVGLFYLPLMFYIALAHVVDYRILKSYYLKNQKCDLNISCGNTDCGGINADVVERNVPNFVLIKDIYNLPFEDKQFDNVVSSHTIEHTDNPELFFKELNRISKNVTLFVPPVWDLFGLMAFREHKWQFLTFSSKHVNRIPLMVKLPYWGIQERFNQKLRC